MVSKNIAAPICEPERSFNEQLDARALRPWKRTALAAYGSRALSHG